MKPKEEIRQRLEAMRVSSATVTMVMKGEEPEYRVKFTLEVPGETPERAEGSLVWRDFVKTKAEIERTVSALACGDTKRLPKSSITANWTRWKTRRVFLRLQQTIRGYAQRTETKRRTEKAGQAKKIKAAREALVESMKALLRAHPNANRGDVMRAFAAAKRFETVRTVMEE